MSKYDAIVRQALDWIKSLPEGTVFGFPNPKTGRMYVPGAVNIAEALGFPADKDPNLTGDWKSERTQVQMFAYEASSGGQSEGNRNRSKTGRLTKFDGANVERWAIDWNELKAAAFDKSFDSCFAKVKVKTKAGSPKVAPVTWVRV